MTRKTAGNNLEVILGSLFILFLVARIFIQFEPLDYFPHGDSAVFLNIGRKILHGQVPYLDVWDHKGPLLYFINAFGLWIYGLWGVWILQFILTYIGLWIAYLSGRSLLGVIPSLIGILTGYCLLDLFMAGNLTEEYSSSFALLSFGLYLLYFQNAPQKPTLFGIGFLFMSTFLIRPNNIGFQSAIILSMGIVDAVQKNIRGLQEKMVWIGSGMLVLFVSFLVYFGINHALRDFYDQAFYYNFIYVTMSGESLKFNFNKFLPSPVGLFLYISFISYGVILFWGRRIKAEIQLLENRFLLLLCIAFPMELCLSRISGREYDHYYLTWLPYLIFATGFVISRIFHIFPSLEKMNRGLFLIIIIACFFTWSPLQTIGGYARIGRDFIYNRANGLEKNHPLVDYIHDNTRPQDKVLLWGFGRWLTYLIDRESPSKYLYQFALTTPGYTTDEMVDDFAHALEFEKPKFIIEAIDYFIPLDSKRLLTYDGFVPRGYINIVKFVEQNYHVVKSNYYFDGQFKADRFIKIWILNTPGEANP